MIVLIALAVLCAVAASACRMRSDHYVRKIRNEQPYCEGWSGRMNEHDEHPGCEC